MKVSLTQIEPGKWECRWWVQDSTGKELYRRRRFPAKNKTEAERTRTRIQAEVDAGKQPIAGNITVAQLMDRWLRDGIRGSVRDRTMKFHMDNARLHIAPGLGLIRLDRLKAGDIDRFERTLLDAGLSGTTVRNVHATLRQALNQAERWGVLTANPIRAVTQPRKNDPSARFLSEEELRNLLGQLKGKRLYLPVLLAGKTGMRRGEVLGLQWQDYNEDAQQLSVRQVVEVVRGKLQVKPPKTKKSQRTLKITKDVIEALKEEHTRQAEMRAMLGTQWNKEGWLVTNDAGDPWKPNTFSSIFAQWIRDNSFEPRIRYHDLRHTHASHLIWAGIPLKMISQRLGHETIKITMDIYGHLLEAHDSEAVDRLEAHYEGKLGDFDV